MGSFIETISRAIKEITEKFASAPPSPVVKCPAGAVTEAEANKLFKELANQKHIPFDFPDDCCYSRAHEMCRITNEKGVKCGKVWNYAHDYPGGAGLKADTPNHPDGHVNWRYHVAPTVKVCDSDGKTRDMVMDPSLFGGPVTIDEWKKRQQDDKSKIETTDDKPYFRGPGDNPMVKDEDGSETKAMLAEHTRNRDKRKLSKGK
jgi:hypothetical protein